MQEALPETFVGRFGRSHEPGFPPGVFGLFPDGQKFDILIHSPDDAELRSLRDHYPLFDSPDCRLSWGEPVGDGHTQVAPYFPDHAVHSFFSAIEAATELLCRGEAYLVFRNAQIRVEVAWIPLFLAESGIRKIDGKRNVQECLNTEQRNLLSQLMRAPFDDHDKLRRHMIREMEAFEARARELLGATPRWPSKLVNIVVSKFLRDIV